MLRPTGHQALRLATADCHQRLDQLFSGFDLGQRAGYEQFLLAHAAAALPVEQALDAAGMARHLADWPARRRGEALRHDLQRLHLDVPATLPFTGLLADGAAWGAAYVLEGSRLGGRVLAGRLAAGLPQRYLATPAAPGSWPGFLKALDTALDTPERQAAASAAAVAVFACFEQAGRAQLAEPA